MSVFESISVNRLATLDGQGNIELIDVRTPAEYRQVRAVIARNVPLESLDPEAVMKARNGSADQPLYVICHGGNRSAQACQRFIDAGHTNVVNVQGGTKAWDEAGLPVVRGRAAISLERQVRIAAGVLVLLAAVLSFWNISFAALAGVVGAGLMFAGITDTCPMAMTIARMPWNQVKKEASCCGIN